MSCFSITSINNVVTVLSLVQTYKTIGDFPKAVQTINLFANGKLIATIEGGSATTTRYITTDHLGSINTVRDGSGNTEETINYYPYGEMNQDEKATAYDSSRKFIGETFDNSTSLSYLQARYMNGTTGRFLSEDPVFLGVPKGQNLENPQSLNSYGYANGNPIVNRDPSGKCIEDACVGEAVMTSPIWGPAVIAGATAVGTSLYYGTEALIRGRNEPRWAGTVPTIDPSEFGLGQSPMGMEDMPKLNPNTPKWTKWTIVTLCGVHIANSLYDLYLEQKSGTTVITNKTEEKSNSTTQNAKNSSSPGKTPSASFVSKTSNNLSTLQTTLNTISTVAIKLSQILSKTK